MEDEPGSIQMLNNQLHQHMRYSLSNAGMYIFFSTLTKRHMYIICDKYVFFRHLIRYYTKV